MPHHQEIRVAAYLILRRGGDILLLRRFNTGYEDGKYSLIAGHVEPSETPSQAIIREAREETSIGVALDDLRFVRAVHRKCTEELAYVDYFFETSGWTGDPIIVEQDKCSELDWFPANTLPDDTIPYIRAFLAQSQPTRRDAQSERENNQGGGDGKCSETETERSPHR